MTRNASLRTPAVQRQGTVSLTLRGAIFDFVFGSGDAQACDLPFFLGRCQQAATARMNAAIGFKFQGSGSARRLIL
jgi:hypothetical protein